jgi:hypothetical protein
MTTCKGDCKNYPHCKRLPNGQDKLDFMVLKTNKVVDITCVRFSRKKLRTGLCEACEKFEEQWVIKPSPDYDNGKDKPYHVCSNCMIGLTTYSLKPEQFKNLIKSGHNPSEHLLHGDFYDDDGNALQSLFE